MIRHASIEDLPSILHIILSNNDVFEERELPAAEQDIYQSFTSDDPRERYFVYVQGAEVIGCIGYNKRIDTDGIYKLSWLAVHPSHQRKGIATQLYMFIEKRVHSEKGRVIYLNAGSGEKNRHFYKKMGFKLTGTIPRYYSHDKDLVWYSKELK